MIPGFTSTASKRPGALFGGEEGVPTRMVRASGCRVWDDSGREYLDTIMALGSVALGYGHPRVTEAAISAARKGVIGPLPPVLEGEVAERLNDLIPLAEGTRFFKTGAEAMAAAVRIGRVHTGRERAIRCGYHGWLDWCQTAAGVPAAVGSLAREVPFNDVEALRLAVEQFEPLAAIVVEPVVDGQPSAEWLAALTEACEATSAVLVFDEIKTAFRLQAGGAAERFGVEPDLMVVGKALGNGFPIAAVCGNEARLREVGLPLREPFAISGGRMEVRRSLIVELHDESGRIGYGESAPFERPFYSGETIASARACIVDELLPRVLHASLSHPSEGRDLLTEGVRGNRMAVAGVETALWDLAATQRGASLASLVSERLVELGVAGRWLEREHRITCGVALGIPKSEDPHQVGRAVARALERGYRRVKLKIRPGWDVEPLRVAHEAIDRSGRQVPLWADANGAYDRARDKEALARIDALGLLFLEQPLAPESRWDARERCEFSRPRSA